MFRDSVGVSLSADRQLIIPERHHRNNTAINLIGSPGPIATDLPESIAIQIHNQLDLSTNFEKFS